MAATYGKFLTAGILLIGAVGLALGLWVFGGLFLLLGLGFAVYDAGRSDDRAVAGRGVLPDLSRGWRLVLAVLILGVTLLLLWLLPGTGRWGV